VTKYLKHSKWMSAYDPESFKIKGCPDAFIQLSMYILDLVVTSKASHPCKNRPLWFQFFKKVIILWLAIIDPPLYFTFPKFLNLLYVIIYVTLLNILSCV
jgi:hypothetical protein